MFFNNHQRFIAHMDLDTFFVSVERLKDSRLNGCPIIVGGMGGRGVVAACSYETRAYGVKSGMPMAHARRLCPQATIVSTDYHEYERYSNLVSEIVLGKAPLAERASIDEFYLDLTGMERLFGCYKWTVELAQSITRETGLPVSFGLAANKAVAKIATNEAKPKGSLWIKHGTEQPFLDPLTVRKIPMVGPVLAQRLAQLGIVEIKTLREIPEKVLANMFGKTGTMLWQRARGIDHSEVVPSREEKSLSTESTFSEDSIDVVALKSSLKRMTEGLAFALRKANKLTACVSVKIRYADFNTFSKQAAIPFTSNTTVLCKKAQELFDKLFERRQRIRLIGVCFSNLAYGGHQANLFLDTEEGLALDKAIDKIKSKYGALAITSAGAMGGLMQHGGHHESRGSDHQRRNHDPVRPVGTSREFPEWVPDATLWEPTQDGY